jgi:hypothetical protein
LLFPAAMKEIGNADRREVGRRLDNRAENSHQPRLATMGRAASRCSLTARAVSASSSPIRRE